MIMNMLIKTRTLALTGRPPLPTVTASVRRRKMSTRTSTEGNSSSKVAPMVREFVRVGGGGSGRGQPDCIRFRLVSYNILAQVYVKSSLFPHSPSPCLRWKARSQALLTLLKNLRADFFCLQEVDEYESFYKKNMEDHGYSSIYVQRSGQKRDGCGIFYKNNGAEMLAKEIIEYNDLVDLLQGETTKSADKQNETPANIDNGAASENDSSVKSCLEHREDPNDPRVRLKRDCVGIMAAFRLKDPFHHVVILANTHLYWDPEWADVKLAQAKYLLSRLAQFKTMVTEKFGCTPSLILSGDFNSTPGDKVCNTFFLFVFFIKLSIYGSC
ncbi:hypothetical protein PTKIN_Ptkin04bG0244200 [Pterospermum kingtungense]